MGLAKPLTGMTVNDSTAGVLPAAAVDGQRFANTLVAERNQICTLRSPWAAFRVRCNSEGKSCSETTAQGQLPALAAVAFKEADPPDDAV